VDVPCLVISLKRATDRRNHIAAEFEKAGLSFEFIDATDARDLPARHRLSPEFGLPIAPGDLACTISHGRAMKHVIERG